MKKWKLTYEVNMQANLEDNVIVKANTERKAIIIGEKEISKKYFFNKLKKCEEVMEV